MTGEEAAECAVRQVLSQRMAPATACPSEAARLLDPEQWRERMDEVREAAARLADNGELEVTQRGEVVDVRRARGPVRLRRVAGDGPGRGRTDDRLA